MKLDSNTNKSSFSHTIKRIKTSYDIVVLHKAKKAVNYFAKKQFIASPSQAINISVSYDDFYYRNTYTFCAPWMLNRAFLVQYYTRTAATNSSKCKLKSFKSLILLSLYIMQFTLYWHSGIVIMGHFWDKMETSVTHNSIFNVNSL